MEAVERGATASGLNYGLGRQILDSRIGYVYQLIYLFIEKMKQFLVFALFSLSSSTHSLHL